MMKKLIGMVNLLILSGVLQAENLSIAPKWSGFYAGVKADELFNQVKLRANNIGFVGMMGTCNQDSRFSSFSPGVDLGFAHQYDTNWVLGLEGNYNYNNQQSTNLSCDCPTDIIVSDHFSFSNRNESSLVGRLGYAFRNNSLFPFLSAGGSLANLKLKYQNEIGNQYTKNSTESAWLLGLGLEWRMSEDWSLRAEYDYAAYNKINMPLNTVYGLTDPDGNAHASLYTNKVGLALQYWFH